MSKDTATERPAETQAGEPARSGTRSLLIMGEAGVSTRPLPELGEVTLGRSEECNIRIDDPKLSRKHLLLRIGAHVQAVDLGSLNGTSVRDRTMTPGQPVTIGDGDTITLGSTILVIQNRPAATRARRLLAHGYFEARLEEECTRAEHRGTSFAVLRLALAEAHKADAAEELLGECVRPTDVIGAYLPGEYEILAVDLPADEAERLGAELRESFVGRDIAAEVSVTCFPRDGRTPEALVARSGARFRETYRDSGGLMVSRAMQRLEPIVARIAPSNISVVILGETGVGKEVLARTIHVRSPRAAKAFLAINCAALAEPLLESELFGHERGAFTGALAAKDGLLETAEGGTVLLDEVGEMPLGLQAKLLRVLEQREVMRVGSLKPRPIDVRFLAATNRDLEGAVAQGTFRQDLYFRLNGISIVIPPLRDRIEELEPLAQAFIKDALKRAGRHERMTIGAEALSLLKRYRWPGNIRELRNVIERAVLLSTGGTITPKHLPIEKMGPILPTHPTRMQFDAVPPPPPRPARPGTPWEDRVTEVHATMPVGPNDASGESERARILAALERCAGNQTQAAKLLGFSRRTLVTKLEAYSLPRPRKR